MLKFRPWVAEIVKVSFKFSTQKFFQFSQVFHTDTTKTSQKTTEKLFVNLSTLSKTFCDFFFINCLLIRRRKLILRENP